MCARECRRGGVDIALFFTEEQISALRDGVSILVAVVNAFVLLGCCLRASTSRRRQVLDCTGALVHGM